MPLKQGFYVAVPAHWVENPNRMRMSYRFQFTRGSVSLAILIAALASQVAPSLAVSPSPSETFACNTWAARTFSVTNLGLGFEAPHLEIVYQDVADGLARGQSWRGTSFQLGGTTYTQGLAFNSTKHIRVVLGQPARQFSAVIGLENNDDTRRGEALGQGSVTFHVLVRSNEVFASPVMRLKDGPKPLVVPLEGATDFEIRVRDGGDGRGWDQALWADAVILMEDHSRIRLQDLPLVDVVRSNPFAISFRYGETNSSELLARWPRTTHDELLDVFRSLQAISWRDPTSGLQVQIEIVHYRGFPAVEWVARFTNTGQTNTPILEDIEAMDGPLPVPASGVPVLHWNTGGVASFDDFAPQQKILEPGGKLHLQPGGGRSSSQVLPFFNLETSDGGVIAAIGWTGEWAADFSRNAQAPVSLKSGMARTHLTLLPGETIRTPRMCLLFYQGDAVRGQNLWRQFVLAHHRPRLGGKPLVAPITCGNWGGTTAEVHLDNIHKIDQYELPLKYYWIDADWFGQGGWPVSVGNWEVKKDLYPSGFKPLSDALRGAGRELMLWFEPERVYRDTPWQKTHPEWLLGSGDNFLLNLGNPAARKFLTDFISARVDEFGLGCYRQDFNIDPLGYWQAADAPDRQGATEIHYVEGLYAFWDELLARHPNLMIDNCASGGRRLDLETLGRATPFWRTDGPRDPIAHQCHTYGLLSWVPLNATSQDRATDDYEFRSSMSSALCLNWWVSGDAPAERIPADFPFAWAKSTLDQYLKLREFYYGDYYPLTSYSQSADFWMAYQLAAKDGRRGLIVALRRPKSPYTSARFPLQGLEENASYRLTNLDSRQQITLAGRELLKEGAKIELVNRPGSALVEYERQ